MNDENDEDFEGEEEDDSHESYSDGLHNHHTLGSPIISTYAHGDLGHNHHYGKDRQDHNSDSGAEHEEEEHSQHGEKVIE